MSCTQMPLAGFSPTRVRPTVATDTGTAAPGAFDLEGGVVFLADSTISLPFTLMYGVGERTELFIDFVPFVASENGELTGGEDSTGAGVGDVVLGTRHRFWQSDFGTSAAVQVATKIATSQATRGLSSGENDFMAAAVLTHEFGETAAVTAFHQLALIGAPDGEQNWQSCSAFMAWHSLPGHLGVFGELAAFENPGLPREQIATLGLAQTVNDRLAVDCALSLDRCAGESSATIQLGFSYSLGGS